MKRISVPGSKSVTNRALVLSAISDAPTDLSGVLLCDDSEVLIKALENFGVRFERLGANNLRVFPPRELQGNGTKNFIGNAGTSTRFLTALSLIVKGNYSLHGVDRMHERPFEDLFDAVRSLGVEITFEGEKNFLPATFQTPSSPLFVKEGDLPREIVPIKSGLPAKAGISRGEGGVIKISGSISSQFLSGLLLVAPKMPQGLKIQLVGDLSSRPYVEMTLEMLKIWGVKYTVNRDFNEFEVFPGITTPKDFSVPADSSSASYPLLWSMLSGEPLEIENFGKVTLQGDEKFLEVLKRAGGKISRSGDTVKLSPPKKITALGTFDFSAMPDVSMTAMVLAACASGESTLTGLQSLRVKECDRIKAMQENLEKLGVQVEVVGDQMKIIGRDAINRVPTGMIDSFEDHRIAMVFGVLRSALKLDFEITNPECVAKSWPEFWLDLADLEGTLRRVSSVIVRKSPLSREIPQSGNISRGKPPFTKGGNTFLIVKKPRKTHAWQFPQGGTEGAENGIKAAQRELAEECGQDLKVKFLFDQPIGKYKYFFPADFKRHNEKFRGARVRFFLAEFVSGEVEIDPAELESYQWVTREELPKYFEKDYWGAVGKFL